MKALIVCIAILFLIIILLSVWIQSLQYRLDKMIEINEYNHKVIIESLKRIIRRQEIFMKRQEKINNKTNLN